MPFTNYCPSLVILKCKQGFYQYLKISSVWIVQFFLFLEFVLAKFYMHQLLLKFHIHLNGLAQRLSQYTKKELLPKDAGMDGPKEIPLVAFGSPPNSKTFFQKKLHSDPLPSPDKLKSWSIFRSTPKTKVETP